MPEVGPEYHLILTPLAGYSVPPVVRLRKALKALARSFGLACRSARELPAAAAQDGPGQAGAAGGGPGAGGAAGAG
jgi:hypothetical protein